MEVNAPLLALVPIKISSLAPLREDLAPLFRLGDQLSAKVLASTAGKLLLEIEGFRLSAETTLNVPQGASLRLQVVQTQPKVELKVLPSPTPQTTVVSALRQALPEQIPLAQALNELKAAQTQDLAPQIRAQIEALFNSLPERDDLMQPDKLASLVRLSGLFHEALVASKGMPDDLKARLLALKAALPPPTRIPARPADPALPPSADSGPPDPALKTLAEKASGALAHIVLDQLASLPKPDRQFFTWHLTLPYRDGERLESLHLIISGKPKRQSPNEEPWPWTVEMELAPDGLDCLRIKLILEGDRVSSYFKSTPQTVHLLARHLDALRERLRAVGLIPYHLQAVAEERPKSSAVPKELAGALLDEKI
jgi:hypothetical protein